MSDPSPLVIRISPMAHFAVFFLFLGLAALVFVWPNWTQTLFLLPVLVSAAVVRYRTVADRDQVTARTLLSSRSVPWTEIDGLRFDRSSWAKARLTDGSELTLPAVTFATLPMLASVSGGRVPNPYE